MTPDYAYSGVPRRCHYCRKWIRPGKEHLVMFGYEHEYHYCDIKCAKKRVSDDKRRMARRERLEEVIYGKR